ncbi:MAG: class I SAM-dependent methyltransferase [Candidatus Heimdallarchaeota archaeon]|nr:class I SAM-dependent methyltransferase [Candidatus Heimdallarchaeota archaeon]
MNIQVISNEEAQQILSQLGLTDSELFLQNVDHFTNDEGSKRDEIVKDYFGEDGMKILTEELCNSLNGTKDISLVDLGVGTGTFLIPILDKISIKEVVCFDATPKMLELLHEKFSDNLNVDQIIHYVIGDMEQVSKSLEVNQSLRKREIPMKFDRIMSTLAFHHIRDTSKILKGISEILDDQGKAVIIDAILSDTSGMVPSADHAHNGFEIHKIKELADKFFKSVSIRELDVICNDSSCPSRGTGLFIMELAQPL